ncbi:MAG: glycosyltransferase family 2 protein [Desulfuromonadaceae bacterium]
MKSFTLTTPVALLIFNRPETTARVFAAIRDARPAQLLVIADGPRAGYAADVTLCAKVRRIVEQVDWPCDVMRNYSDVNLGCGVRPATGISWVFEQVEEAIILEDDCLPHPTFFRYCQELLERYRDDERIMHIAGNNSLVRSNNGEYSYYYSLFPHCWGWASWRRAWRNFDFDMELFPAVTAEGWLDCIFSDKDDSKIWSKKFMEVYGPHKKHIWDYQWTFACWTCSGLSIIPNNNLISNIGFGTEATHTKDVGSHYSLLSVTPMEFPLNHPPFVIRDADADAETQRNVFRRSILKIVIDAIKYTFRRNI